MVWAQLVGFPLNLIWSRIISSYNAYVHIFSAFTTNVVNWDKNTALFETKEGVIEGREEEERERGEWNRNKKICSLQSTVQPIPHTHMTYYDTMISSRPAPTVRGQMLQTSQLNTRCLSFFYGKPDTAQKVHWPNIAISQLFTKTHNCHNSRSILQNRTDFF